MTSAFYRNKTQREEHREARNQRENAAGKLLLRVPDLISLSLTIREGPPSGCLNNTQYIQRVVVAHAFALFEVPCLNVGCVDGGYDVTREVLSALSSRKVQFEG